MMKKIRKARRKTYPLEYVIVAAHSDDSEFIKELFSREVVLKQSQYIFSRTLKEGLKILTCYPFVNGSSCVDTKVLALKSSAEKFNQHFASSQWRYICGSMHVLAYILALFRPVARSDPAWLRLLFCCWLLVRNWRRRHLLRTVAVSELVMVQLAPSVRGLDYHSVALVNWQTLVYLGLPCYSWVRWRVHNYKTADESDSFTVDECDSFSNPARYPADGGLSSDAVHGSFIGGSGFLLNSAHCSNDSRRDFELSSAHCLGSSGRDLQFSSAHCSSNSGRDFQFSSAHCSSSNGPDLYSNHVCLQMVRCDRVRSSDILISTSMWHALASRSGAPCWRSGQLMGDSVVWQPPIASSVQVAQLYASPDKQFSLDQCETLLKLYFDRDRLLRMGDVLCVPLECDPSWSSARERVARFRVQSVSGSDDDVLDDVTASYLYRHGVTSLSQVSDVTALAPPLQPLTCNEWEHGVIPTGMEEEVNQLVSAIRSVSARLPSSSLFSVPLCPTLVFVSGRISTADWLTQAVISSAAAVCGCPVSSLTCYQLMSESGTSGATCAKLRQKLGRFTSPPPPQPISPHSSPITTSSRDSTSGLLKQVLVLRQAELLATKATASTISDLSTALPSSGDGCNVDWRQLSVLTELIGDLCSAGVCVVLMADSVDQLVPELAQRLTHVLHVPSAPVSGEKLVLLMRQLLMWLAKCQGVSIAAVQNSHGLQTLLRGVQISDLPLLLQRAKLSCMERTEKLFEKLDRPIPPDLPMLSLDLQDFTTAAEMIQSHVATRAGVPRVVSTKWSDIGGLDEVRQLIMDTIELQLSRPELLASGIKRSGILLYGPPGTGKTMVARAVATECNLNFLSVKGPELMNMYIGESEANVRDVFSRARQAAPCVIFFDELDSLAPNRGQSSDSGGVMDRITAQLLSELDSAGEGHGSTGEGQGSAGAAVFVIGATNRPDLLDPALLRPGRLDKLVFLAPADNRQQQLQILRAQTRQMDLSPDVDLDKVVSCLPESVTGADIFALCEEATAMALDRAVHQIETDGADEATVSLQISQYQLMTAASNLVPSVSQEELKRYEQIRRSIEGERNG